MYSHIANFSWCLVVKVEVIFDVLVEEDSALRLSVDNFLDRIFEFWERRCR